jgi:hypothetical protein
VTGLVRRLAELRAHVGFRLIVRRTKALEALTRWLDPLVGTDEVRYRSARDLLFDEVTDGFGDPGSRFYVPPWEVPSDNDIVLIAYTPEQAARRDHIRSALVAEAERVSAKRRRRRRVRRHRVAAFACVLALTAGVVTAGGSALLTGSTGSDAVDAFLNLHASHNGESPPTHAANPGPGGDTRPSLDSASRPVSVPLPQNDSSAVGVSYISNDGRLCGVLRASKRTDTASTVDNLLGCVQPQFAYEQVEGVPATVVGARISDAVLLHGYAREDVAKLAVHGPFGLYTVAMAKPWTPNTPGAVGLRPFFAVAEGRFGPDGITVGEEGALTDRRNYLLTATFADGRTKRVPALPTP